MFLPKLRLGLVSRPQINYFMIDYHIKSQFQWVQRLNQMVNVCCFLLLLLIQINESSLFDARVRFEVKAKYTLRESPETVPEHVCVIYKTKRSTAMLRCMQPLSVKRKMKKRNENASRVRRLCVISPVCVFIVFILSNTHDDVDDAAAAVVATASVDFQPSKWHCD